MIAPSRNFLPAVNTDNFITNFNSFNMKVYSLLAFVFTLVLACKQNSSVQKNESKPWTFEKTIPLDSVAPIGICSDASGNLWISDAGGNQLIQMDSSFNLVKFVSDLDRPMHIQSFDNQIYIAEYGADRISVWNQSEKKIIPCSLPFDAPSGVDVHKNKVYVADFYNHRIVSFDSLTAQKIGKQGKGNAEFNYPTDLQINEQKIYVADTYNNRIQILDLNGNHLKSIADSLEINALTGLFVSTDYVYACDFENSRVLILDKSGRLLQILTEQLDMPTDLIVINHKMLVVNYNGKSISVYGNK